MLVAADIGRAIVLVVAGAMIPTGDAELLIVPAPPAAVDTAGLLWAVLSVATLLTTLPAKAWRARCPTFTARSLALLNVWWPSLNETKLRHLIKSDLARPNVDPPRLSFRGQ